MTIPHGPSRWYSAAVLVMLSPLLCFSQIIGYHFRLDEWQARAIKAIGIRYPESRIFLNEQPYSRKEVAQLLILSEKKNDQSISAFYAKRLMNSLRPVASTGKRDYYFELLWRNVPSYSDHLNPKHQFRLESDLLGYAEWGANLCAYFDFQADTDGAADLDYHGEREWKNIAGDMRAAFFQYHAKNWDFLLGREYVHWGPGYTGALLTSGFAPALDMFKLTATLWKFRFQGFNALLNPTAAESQQNINRYFSGHRLSLRLSRIEFGLSETVANGGPNRNVHGGQLNFLIPYYLTDVMNASEKRDDNVTVSLDAALYWPQNLRFYGQLVIDEYYYEGEPYPNRTGFLLGLDWLHAFFLKPLWLNLEYARLDRWLYNYEADSPWNRLTYFNAILGHPLGPDADIIRIEPEVYLGRQFSLRPLFQYIRQGETSVNTPLVTKEQYKKNHPPFPYGIVEESKTAGFLLEYSPSIHWIVSGFVHYRQVENDNHVKGKSREEVAFRVSVRNDLQIVF